MKKLPFLLTFISILTVQIIATRFFGLNRYIAALLFAALLYLLFRYSGLNREDVGASKISRKSIVWSVVIFGSIFTFLGLTYLIVPSAFMDSRYDKSFTATIVSILFILPLTTVLLEEFAFRGVLLGLLLKTGSKMQALLISSLLFGLWHVFSSLDVRPDSFLFFKHPPQLLISLFIVLVTGAAGWIFSILRLKTKSLLVPIVAHWSVNACGILFAWLAWHR